jgi:hypothetical protein
MRVPELYTDDRSTRREFSAPERVRSAEFTASGRDLSLGFVLVMRYTQWA